ncbi:MAG TPA: ribulose-phosphate 3-epimerase, partial [Desulfobacterales bacterium]|nr:ribulose-phosphate 3-epimerase [Desulfobacterales bacterium]
PGFGGQSFIESTLGKTDSLRKRIDQLGLYIGIEIDGGISPKTIGRVAEAGANIFVAGSAIYGCDEYAPVIAEMRKLAEEGKAKRG